MLPGTLNRHDSSYERNLLVWRTFLRTYLRYKSTALLRMIWVIGGGLMLLNGALCDSSLLPMIYMVFSFDRGSGVTYVTGHLKWDIYSNTGAGGTLWYFLFHTCPGVCLYILGWVHYHYPKKRQLQKKDAFLGTSLHKWRCKLDFFFAEQVTWLHRVNVRGF